MTISSRKEQLFLFAGDVIFFCISLWIALTLRHFTPASYHDFRLHIIPFAILIAVWILIFFIAGLYDKHALIFRRKLPFVLLHTQILNSIVAVFFFYFIPYFSITPKTVLFIYLFISFVYVLGWRLYGLHLKAKRKKHKAILIGSGEEMEKLKKEINDNPRYTITFISSIDLRKNDYREVQDEISKHVAKETIATIIIDLHNEKVELALPAFYNLLFSHVQFIDFHKFYEYVFDRIPLSLISYTWFLENVSLASHRVYDIGKRLMDISASVILGVISLIIYPFVIFAIKLDDRGAAFIIQDRVGQNNRIIRVVKFRTMRVSDSGKWVVENDPRITRVGKMLRTSRIDELPQLWNVLKGDLSLVGPRPELPELVKLYEREIPYYNIRHLIKPGLSGWGQIHHEKPPHSIEGTKEKLSYDLYYLKNRSFLLDIEIALKTIKTLLSRSGI